MESEQFINLNKTLQKSKVITYSENTKIEVSKDGTLGYVFGTHSFLKAEDNSVFEHVHHLYVWRKHEDTWKMEAIHISHPPKQ